MNNKSTNFGIDRNDMAQKEVCYAIGHNYHEHTSVS